MSRRRSTSSAFAVNAFQALLDIDGEPPGDTTPTLQPRDPRRGMVTYLGSGNATGHVGCKRELDRRGRPEQHGQLVSDGRDVALVKRGKCLEVRVPRQGERGRSSAS